MGATLLAFAFTVTPPPFVPTLNSTALTPEQFATVFQPIVANILGLPTDPYPWGVSPNPSSWKTVRIGWQQQGQPAWKITENVCILLATPVNDPFSQVRDGTLENDNEGNLVQKMSFTQVWNLHFTFYGPRGYDNARKVVSAMALDYAHDALAAKNIYCVVKYNRPQFSPELEDGQWWPRTDVDLQFNEGVNESILIEAAESVDVTLLTNTGISETFEIQA